MHERGLRLAICSGSTKPEIEAVLTKAHEGKLASFFEIMVTSEDVMQGKPSPEGYLLTAKKLGVSPHRCMVIEDTPHGIQAAKQVGMNVIALLTTYKKYQLAEANKIVNSFKELLDDVVMRI